LPPAGVRCRGTGCLGSCEVELLRFHEASREDGSSSLTFGLGDGQGRGMPGEDAPRRTPAVLPDNALWREETTASL